MKLWLLRPHDDLKSNDNPWGPWFDKLFGLVIRAETEQHAREAAYEEITPCNGPENVWTDPKYVTCIELNADGLEEVIIRDEHDA